jgi:peroxiredoxin
LRLAAHAQALGMTAQPDVLMLRIPRRAGRIAERLVGRQIPPLVLESFLSQETSLEVVNRGSCAIYFYPGGTAPVGEDDPSANEDGDRHCSFRNYEKYLAAYGVTPVGISSEPVSAQLEACQRLKIKHPLFSDPGLMLAEELGLPMSSSGERRLYSRLTLVTRRGGIVERVFYPVRIPRLDAPQVHAWLHQHWGKA